MPTEVTAEMRTAGGAALRLHNHGDALEDMAESSYVAMQEVAPEVPVEPEPEPEPGGDDYVFEPQLNSSTFVPPWHD